MFVHPNILTASSRTVRRQIDIRELNQPRQRQQQERHKFGRLTMKNNSSARFARVFFIFVNFADVLALSTT